ncbi:MAG: peroxidase-related enzyme [Alphaproteobacteria bacterium]|nr:peroxidase-related enzyme [Alphaproteobacteria bacterium]HPF46457.1 peroxidase-related enzyme [Emcibacteraceae bacterium]HRW29038.1 peroxidase-related enzyme [Emcibacteraceae bacterium]
MTWIKTISYDDATGKLKSLYDRIKGPDNHIDHIMMAQSLRPHTLEAYMCVDKNLLHNRENIIPEVFLDCIGVYVSIINKCPYCVEHHYARMARLLNDDERALEIRAALEIHAPKQTFDDKHALMLKYARYLTQSPSEITEHLIEKMRSHDITDGEILEINQVTAYFNYANRIVLGLGVELENDKIGLSPGNTADPDD